MDRVVSETARVLEPGGLYLFDTINRTLTSRLVAIKAMQQWPLTRLTDVAFHDWDMFITPAELAGILERHGLVPAEMTGLGARAGPLTALLGFISARRGRITYGELSRRLDVGQVEQPGRLLHGLRRQDGTVTTPGVCLRLRRVRG